MLQKTSNYRLTSSSVTNSSVILLPTYDKWLLYPFNQLNYLGMGSNCSISKNQSSFFNNNNRSISIHPKVPIPSRR